jgi:hypothetical protein
MYYLCVKAVGLTNHCLCSRRIRDVDISALRGAKVPAPEGKLAKKTSELNTTSKGTGSEVTLRLIEPTGRRVTVNHETPVGS